MIRDYSNTIYWIFLILSAIATYNDHLILSGVYFSNAIITNYLADIYKVLEKGYER